MQAMLRGETPYPHISDTMDFCLVEVALGRTVFQGTPQLKHYNPLGSVHGGWYATLLDSAVGCAVHTMMPIGRAYTTAELSVNIVRRPAKAARCGLSATWCTAADSWPRRRAALSMPTANSMHTPPPPVWCSSC
jgi:uncharacterized protein (TIGR00369 family)